MSAPTAEQTVAEGGSDTEKVVLGLARAAKAASR